MYATFCEAKLVVETCNTICIARFHSCAEFFTGAESVCTAGKLSLLILNNSFYQYRHAMFATGKLVAENPLADFQPLSPELQPLSIPAGGRKWCK